MTTTKTHKMCFKIYGEDLVRLARSIWADDRRPDKALRIMVEGLMGMTEEIAVSILTGKKTLKGCSSDPKGVFMVDDDATETEHGNPLSLYEMIACEMAAKQRLTEELHDMTEMADPEGGEWGGSPGGLIKMPKRQWKRLRDGECGWKDLESFYYHKLNAPQNATEELISDQHREVGQMGPAIPQLPGAAGKMQKLGQDKLDRLIDRAKSDKARPKPKPDTKLRATNGWVDRMGHFYPCAYTAHDELAEDLGMGLREIEEKGWVKISDSQMSAIPRDFDVLCPDKSATKKQIAVIMDWCIKHKRKLPDWLGS